MVANKQPNFLTTTPSREIHVTHHHQEDDLLELDESDVVWGGRPDDDDVVTPPPPLPTIKTTYPTSPLHSLSSPGLTAALPSTSPQSPNTAFHRRRTHTTSSSPLSMESQSQSQGQSQRGSHHQYRRASVNNKYLPQSAPMQVPAWPAKKNNINNNIKYGRFDEDEVGLMDGEDDGEMVPPHEIVVARSQRETAFSVFEGVGRTLKGRDLTTVRNAVFHKTGFL